MFIHVCCLMEKLWATTERNVIKGRHTKVVVASGLMLRDMKWSFEVSGTQHHSWRLL